MSDQMSVGDMPAFRRHVRARILRELELTSGATRRDLMRELVLSRTALTRVLEPMFTAGEVIEDPPVTDGRHSRGRPARILRLRVPPRLTLAVHLMHDSMVVAHINEAGEMLGSLVHPVGITHGFGTAERIIHRLAAELADSTTTRVDRCVVILPTMIDPSGVRVMPAGAQELMPTWIGAAQRDRIARTVGAPTWLENDGRLGALGEARFGAARQSHNMLYVAVGSNGIGGGLIIGRELHRGAGLAGEISHISVRDDGQNCPCGRRGCLAAEVRAMILELSRQSSAHINEPSSTARDAIVERIVNDIGRAVAGAANVAHPDTIVIANRLGAGVLEELFDRVRSDVFARAHPEIAKLITVIEGAPTGTYIVRAAGVVALEEIVPPA